MGKQSIQFRSNDNHRGRTGANQRSGKAPDSGFLWYTVVPAVPAVPASVVLPTHSAEPSQQSGHAIDEVGLQLWPLGRARVTLSRDLSIQWILYPAPPPPAGDPRGTWLIYSGTEVHTNHRNPARRHLITVVANLTFRAPDPQIRSAVLCRRNKHATC